MYQHHLDEMANVITNKLADASESFVLDNSMLFDLYKYVRAALEEYWADKMALVWHIDDVFVKAGELGIALSNEEAKNILGDILDHHDCEMGVSWLTLGIAIQDYPRNGE